MKTLVAYYSLSGTTRPVAAALAEELGADVQEIRCARYRPRFSGFIQAGYDSWADRLPSIETSKHPPSGYDLVVIGGPMWVWRAATPVRAYLHREASKLANVAFFLTLGGAPADKAFREMQALAGRAPTATLVVSQVDVTAGQFNPAVRSFAAALRERETTSG
ncbi:MAG TPA: flavodoxin [Hyphomicrobiaceae bacterium]|jgi:flavodoxin|nr:flavodoxin [Hyphomicrobiaceae bacterium]